MKKDRNYYAQYGYMQPREIKPFDVNIESFNPQQVQLPTIQGQENLQETGNPGLSGSIGSATLSGLRSIGGALNTAMNMAPQFLNALLPDQPLTREDRTLPRAYNPYPQGTGSQGIYRRGGKVKKNKNDVFTSLSDEEAAYYYNNNIPLPKEDSIQPLSIEEENVFMSPNALQPINTQIPFANFSNVPSREPAKRIEYERLVDRQGNAQYSPIFPESYNYSEATNAMNNLPEYFGNVPVVRSPELYRDLRQNFNPSSTSYDWEKAMGLFEKGGMLKPYTTSKPNYKNGGYVEGQEVDLTMEEIRRLQDLGYELEF